jgi:toxin secretion/phage lysis holin
MNWELIFKVIVTGVGAVFGFLFGGWSTLLLVLLVFMGIDYVTGIIASFIEGKLSSKIGFRGILKKVAIILIVVASHMIDLALIVEGFTTKEMIMDSVVFFYLGNELLSFTENAGRMGVPLPAKLTNAVAVLKSKGDEKNGL